MRIKTLNHSSSANVKSLMYLWVEICTINSFSNLCFLIYLKLHTSTILEIQCISQITLLKTRKGKTFQIIFSSLLLFKLKLNVCVNYQHKHDIHSYLSIHLFININLFMFLSCCYHTVSSTETKSTELTDIIGPMLKVTADWEVNLLKLHKYWRRVKGKTRTGFQ